MHSVYFNAVLEKIVPNGTNFEKYKFTSRNKGMKHKPFSLIKTERLVIRPYAMEDAPQLYAAMKDGTDHLLRWLPWAEGEPRPLAEKQKLIFDFIEKFETDKDFVYAIFDKTNTRLLGGTGLHPRVGPNAIEIGYWVRHGETNKGIATEASYALTKAAFLLDFEQVIIRMKPENEGSARIPQKLKFTEDNESEYGRPKFRLYAMNQATFQPIEQFEPLEFIN